MATTTLTGILANINPQATTITRLYQVPVTGLSFTVTAKLVVTNNGAAGTFRVYIGTFSQTNLEAVTLRYIPPAGSLAAGSTLELPGRGCMQAGAWVDVWASHANMNFALEGTQETVVQ